MAIKGKKDSKLMRCMKKPIKILARARDLCWQSMSGGGGGGAHVFYGGTGMSCPTPQVGSLSRNTSSTNSNHYTSKDAWSSKRSSTPAGARRGVVASVPRSHSVPIGRIDEDESCDFDGDMDDMGMNSRVAYPRCRSYEIPRNNKLVCKDR